MQSSSSNKKLSMSMINNEKEDKIRELEYLKGKYRKLIDEFNWFSDRFLKVIDEEDCQWFLLFLNHLNQSIYINFAFWYHNNCNYTLAWRLLFRKKLRTQSQKACQLVLNLLQHLMLRGKIFILRTSYYALSMISGFHFQVRSSQKWFLRYHWGEISCARPSLDQEKQLFL